MKFYFDKCEDCGKPVYMNCHYMLCIDCFYELLAQHKVSE